MVWWWEVDRWVEGEETNVVRSSQSIDLCIRILLVYLV